MFKSKYYQLYPEDWKVHKKHELYRKCPPKKMKDKNMNKIESSSRARNVMTLKPLLNLEIENVGCQQYPYKK